MFETKGVIDKAFYQSVKSTLLEPWWKCLVLGFATLFLLFAVISVFDDLGLLALIWTVGALILTAEYFLAIRKVIRVSLGRLKERVGSESVQVTTRFLPDCIEVTYEGEVRETVAVKYEHFIKVEKHEAAYILKTEFKQAVIIFKNDLTPKDEENLLDFLKAKQTKIKWK